MIKYLYGLVENQWTYIGQYQTLPGASAEGMELMERGQYLAVAAMLSKNNPGMAQPFDKPHSDCVASRFKDSDQWQLWLLNYEDKNGNPTYQPEPDQL